MKSILEEQIRTEVTQFVDSGKEEHFYFNNFHLNLPGNTRRVTLQDYLDDKQFTRNGRTPRDFFADVDTALEESGVDIDKLAKLMLRYKELKIRKQIFELVFPAYVKLRQMGYSKKDLTE